MGKDIGLCPGFIGLSQVDYRAYPVVNEGNPGGG